MKREALEKVKEIKDTHLYNIESENKEFRIACGAGLYFRVSPTGKRTWQVRFKSGDGKWKWHSLGAYPQISLVNAKFQSAEIFVKLNNNEKIFTAKELAQHHVVQKQLTFEDLMNKWLDTKKVNWVEKTFQKEKQSIEKRLFPIFGDRDFRKILSEEWLDFFLQLQRNEKIYNRIKKLVTHIRSAYDLAKFKGNITSNPLDG